MALESGHRLMFIAGISLAFWAFTWLISLPFPFSGARFWYMFFGIAEPLIFLLVWFTTASYFTLVVVAIQFALHVLALILRLLAVAVPFTSSELDDLLFIILETIAVFIYLWYTYAAQRAAAHADDAPAYERKRD